MNVIQPHFLRESFPNGFKYLMSLGQRDLQMGKCQLRQLNGSFGVEEELFQTGQHVVWSQGAEVKMAYTFKDPVDFAIWCRFRRDNSCTSNEALCVVLDQTVRCFMHDGQELCISLPGKPLNIWPVSPFGALFEFDSENELEMEGEDMLADRFMVVESPFGFLEPVHLSGSQSKRGRQTSLIESHSNDNNVSLFAVLQGRNDESLILSAFPDSSHVYLHSLEYDQESLNYKCAFVQTIETGLIEKIHNAVIYDNYDGNCVLAFLNGDNLIAQPVGSTANSKSWFSEPAISIASTEMTRYGKRDLLVLENESTLSIRIHKEPVCQLDLPSLADFGSDKVRVTRRSAKKIIRATKLANPVENRVDISFSQGHNLRIALDAKPVSDMVSECFEALAQTLSIEKYEKVFSSFLSQQAHGIYITEFEWFVAAMGSSVNGNDCDFSNSIASANPDSSVIMKLQSVLKIFEQFKTPCVVNDKQIILKALQKPFSDLIDCKWRQDDFENILVLLFVLALRSDDYSLAKYYASFDSHLAVFCPIAEMSHDMIDNPTSSKNVLFNDIMRKYGHSFSEFAREIVKILAASDTELNFAQELVVRECVVFLQNNPPSNMNNEFYSFICRSDLSKIMGMHTGKHASDLAVENIASNLTRTARVSSMMFADDNRLEEVRRLLSIERIFYAKLSPAAQNNENDLIKQRQALAEKAVATLFGKSAFELYSVLPSQLEKVSAPKISVLGKISRTKLQFKCEDSIQPADVLWPEFHAGVLSGLQLVNSSPSVIDDSWIIFNRPTEPSCNHAGFIFALGLSGALKEMKTFHEFEYLNCKHELTTCALLLGVAAANIQNESERVSKLLSIHNSAFLPSNSIDLNLPFLVQASALVGLGLLHMSSANRHYSNLIIEEISKREISNADSVTVFSDSYSLAAGFAFGFINLGCGLSGKQEEFVQKLSSFIHGKDAKNLKSSGIAVPSSKKFLDATPYNTNVTGPSAIIALSLSYIRSNDSSIANIVELPSNFNALQKFTPDTVLLAIIGRSLIMWESIIASQEWIESLIPKYLDSADPNHVLFYCSILAGACFVISLKFAGSGNVEIFELLKTNFNIISQLLKPRGMFFKDRLNKSVGKGCQEALIIAIGILMAGSGNLDVLKFLRRFHAKTNGDLKYGYHVAVNMAIGFLYLSGALYSFSNSNKSVALLLCACFPRFPISIGDNRTHLQPLRHLWTLAAESRCIVTEDFDSGEITKLPVSITTKSGEVIYRESPFLLPSVEKLCSISIDTERYFKTSIDTRLPVFHDFLHSVRSLYVKKHTECSEELFRYQQELVDKIININSPSLIIQHLKFLNDFFSDFGAELPIMKHRKWKMAKFKILESLKKFDTNTPEMLAIQYGINVQDLQKKSGVISNDKFMMKFLSALDFMPVGSVYRPISE